MTKLTMENALTVFIYYKIPTSEHQHYLTAIHKLKQAIAACYPFLQISHQKRPELDEEKRELWMETYNGIPQPELATFTVKLAQLAGHYGLPAARKHEVFTAL